MEIYMIKLVAQNSGENENFSLNVVKTNGSQLGKSSVEFILHIQHKD